LATSCLYLHRVRPVVFSMSGNEALALPNLRVQLQQVILNLIDNAIEAMNAVSDDSRVLHLKTEPKDGENVRITVQDSGPGIDAENTERIFDRFFRPNLRVWEWVSPFVAPSSKLTVVVFGSRRDLTEVLFFDFFTG